MTEHSFAIAGIVLAAGMSKRFDGNKLLADFQGKPLIRRVLETALASRLEQVVLVLGYESERVCSVLEPLLDNHRLEVVLNPSYQKGQSSSVIAGLNAVYDHISAAMFLMGDQPMLNAGVIDTLIARYQGQTGKGICYPTCNGQRRNPVIFSERFFPDMLNLSGDTGARALIEGNPDQVITVDFNEPLFFQDVDRQGDLRLFEKDTVKPPLSPMVLIRGAGEMASAIAWRLHRANIHRIVMLELEAPLCVRRKVSFSTVLDTGLAVVEGVAAATARNAEQIEDAWAQRQVAVVLTTDWEQVDALHPDVVIDAILAKRNIATDKSDAPLVIALGPGFEAGRDCHLVIETNRGHDLGRIIAAGPATANTGVPGSISGYAKERVLRAPATGIFLTKMDIGDFVQKGDVIGHVGDCPITAQLSGMLRGLIRSGISVRDGLKLGDIDPRGEREYCTTISDKARAISGSVLECVMRYLNRPRIY